MQKRYAVFFMTQLNLCDVRQVSDNDTEISILIPLDTQFFFFVRTDCELSEVKRNFGVFTIRGNGLFEKKRAYTYGLPVENNTLFFIGEDNGYTIYNGWTGHSVHTSDWEDWNFTIKTIEPKYLNLQKIRTHNKEKKVFLTSELKTFKGLPTHFYYQVTLEPDGDVSGASWDIENAENDSVFYKYSALISNIKAVAYDYPEIYREIINHVDPEEHIYYQNLVNFCKNQIEIIEHG